MPNAFESSLKTAGVLFRKYLNRKKALQFPWSIAELEVTESELAELRSWLMSNDQRIIGIAYSQGWSKKMDPERKHQDTVVCGFLLHILYAEHVRRFGSEGNYWGSISKLNWSAIDRHRLFTSNSQPTQFHKILLEKSAQQLQMRHAFGVEGTFQWFSTGYLQIGFTKKGFLARLPEWLSASQHATTAIETLCSNSSSGSRTFRELWNSLRDYRLKRINKEIIRKRLHDSCWVIPDWHDEIIECAKKRPHLGTGIGNPENTEQRDIFLSQPRLVFSSQRAPEFHLEVINWDDLPLTADEYRVVINCTPRVSLIRQTDGSYAANSTAPISVAFETKEVNASLEDARTGILIASQDLTCWDSDDLVSVFKADGTRYTDPTFLKTGNQDRLFILFPSALKDVSDRPILKNWTSQNRQWTISEISSTASFLLSYEDDLVWSLEESRQTDSIERQCIRKNVKATASPIEALSDSQYSTIIEIEIQEIPGCTFTLNWARIGFEKLKFNQGALRASWCISPENLSHGIHIQYSISANNQTFLNRIHLDIPFTGAIWSHRGKHKPAPTRVLLTRETEQSFLRITPKELGPTGKINDCAITEGNRLVRRLRTGSITLGKLSGMGAPLDLWSDLFNQEHSDQRLADAVIDGGIIHQVHITQEFIAIQPVPGSLLREDFCFYVWVGSNETPMHIMTGSASVHDTEFGTSEWRISNSWPHESISAVAIFFEDNCVGSWWNLKSWTHLLLRSQCGEQAKDYAEVVRLFRCPILYDETQKWVRKFTKINLKDILLSWLMPNLSRELPDGRTVCVQPEHNEGWYRAIGSIFETFSTELDLTTASLILRELAPTEETEEVQAINVSYLLARISPQLAFDVLAAWLKQYALPVHGGVKARKLQANICDALKPEDEEIEDFCKNVSRVNANFLTAHCQQFADNWPSLPKTSMRNLRLLFQFELPRLLATEQRLRKIHL